MKHVKILEYKRNQGLSAANKSLVSRSTGAFYTPESIAQFMIRNLLPLLEEKPTKVLSVIDPFAGDGRLVSWLIEQAHQTGIKTFWKVTLWDQDLEALKEASRRLSALRTKLGIKIAWTTEHGDSFKFALDHQRCFDLVITNPPWETLKPDRRELDELSANDRVSFIEHMRCFDKQLSTAYPNSQPSKKFAGWGTNLSRVGLEASLQLAKDGGALAIVLPSSAFADQISVSLRRWVTQSLSIKAMGYFPAEAKLFESVDQSSMVLVGAKQAVSRQEFELHSLDHVSGSYDSQHFETSLTDWAVNDFCMPFAIRGNSQAFLETVSSLSTWKDFEDCGYGFWAGRELDETGIESKLGNAGKYGFVKGRMVGRFQLERTTRRIAASAVDVPSSADTCRVAWRDVSRPTQRRRMQATLVTPGYVTGNSLNVAFFKDQDEMTTLALLAIVNSLVFEIQVRARSSTSHVSLGVVRGVRIPDLRKQALVEKLGAIAKRCLNTPTKYEADLEVAVAKEYGLGKDIFASLLPSFPGLSTSSIDEMLSSSAW